MVNEPFTLAERTTSFSRKVIAFCGAQKPTFITRPLMDQLIRSATSIGANYAEANNAASRSDFKNKIFIAKKEAAETKYWLSLLEDSVSDKAMCSKLIEDCHHLLMTFQKIISTLNHGKQPIVNGKHIVNSEL